MNNKKGCIYGFILGDAVGAPIEFLSKKGLKQHNITFDNIDFPMVNKPTHKLNSNDRFTDDTEHLLFTLNSLKENNKVDQIDIAKKLVYWKHHGIIELGDHCGRGCGGTIGLLCSNDNFIINPEQCAKDLDSGSNGALMRSPSIPLFSKTFDDMISDTITLCKTTHTNSRCVVSCLILNTLIWNCLHNTTYDIDMFKHLLEDEYLSDYNRYTQFTNLSECELDGSDKNGYFYNQIGYCFKTLSCAIYAYKNRDKPFKDVLKDIYMQGGDTDTNGAIAGSIIGAYIGYDKLDYGWISKINGIEYVNREVDKYLY